MKVISRIHHQKGEIAATLTLISMVLVTIGIVVGTRLASNPKLSSRETLAQANGATIFSNEHIDPTFKSWAGRSGNPKHDVLTGELCFKSVTPPSNGKYTVEVWGLKKGTSANGQSFENQFIVKLGQSLEQRIDSPPNTYKCDGPNYRARPFSAIFWNQFSHVPAPTGPAGVTPTPIPFRKIDEIAVVLRVSGQNWNFRGGAQSPFKFGTLSLESFGEAPTQSNPTATPSASLTPAGPTATPSATMTPSPAPTGAPGDISVKVKFDNQKFTGEFNAFDFVVETCDYAENADPAKFGTISNCGTAPNKKSNLETVRKPGNTDTINQEVPITLSGLPTGKKAVHILGGFYKNYDNPSTKKKDTTGVKYDFGTTCLKTLPTSTDGYQGQSFCVIDVNGNKEQIISVKLPNTADKTFKLAFGKEVSNKTLMQNCAIVSDKNKGKSYASSPCEASYAGNEVRLMYTNLSSDSAKIYWQINRCHGDYDQNNQDCLENFNGKTGTGVDNKSVFIEATGVDVPTGNSRYCIFKPSEFPATETDEAVRAYFANKCTVGVPPTATLTPVPANTSTPTPSPVPTEAPKYYATFSIYNNGQKDIKKVNVKACFGDSPCQVDPLNTTISSKQRGSIDMELKFPEGVNKFKIGCGVVFDGNTAEVPCPSEVESEVRQNIIFRISVDENSSSGNGLTEIQASDVNSDGCTNGSDFSEVVNQYATELEPAEQNRKDVNGDGVINSIDIEYTLSNLNKGDKCQYKPGGLNLFNLFQ